MPDTHRSNRLQRVLQSRLLERLTFPHGIDAYLQAINPSWSASEVLARIESIHMQTDDTVTVTLQPNANWNGFEPGQYIRIRVEVDGVQHTRCFSPANAATPGDTCLELTCKINPDSVVSHYLQTRAQVGSVVHLSQAEGDFALPTIRPSQIVLISGGSGITPVMSMLRTLCNEGFDGSITFLHYANKAESQLYAAELQAIAASHSNVTLLRCHAEPNQGGELEGLFDAAQLRNAVPNFTEAETFLCGPPGLMDRVESAYAEMGVSHQLHTERFTAPSTYIASQDDAGGELRLSRSERLLENNGETLLNQAEAAGLSPQAGCRMGICYTCTCRKTAGRVRDIRNGRISDGEEDIQICVSVPVGTVTVDL